MQQQTFRDISFSNPVSLRAPVTMAVLFFIIMQVFYFAGGTGFAGFFFIITVLLLIYRLVSGFTGKTVITPEGIGRKYLFRREQFIKWADIVEMGIFRPDDDSPKKLSFSDIENKKWFINRDVYVSKKISDRLTSKFLKSREVLIFPYNVTIMNAIKQHVDTAVLHFMIVLCL